MTGVHCSWDDVDDRDVMCGRTLPVLPDILMLGFLRRALANGSVVYMYERLYTQKAVSLCIALGRTVS